MEEKKKRVLIIEDNVGIRKLLTLELRIKGYDIIVAQDGQEGINKAENSAPDILLLDLNLPIMNGLDLLSKLREFSRVPVIAISSHTDMGRQALLLGANIFIAKPFDPDKVAEIIQDLLRE